MATTRAGGLALSFMVIACTAVPDPPAKHKDSDAALDSDELRAGLPGRACAHELDKTCAPSGVDKLVCTMGTWRFNGSCPSHSRCDGSPRADCSCEDGYRSEDGDRCVLAAARDGGTEMAAADSGSRSMEDAGGTKTANRPADDSCSACTPDYPCQQLGSSYTCRGQFAEWPPVFTPTTFRPNADGTVLDTRSMLLWQQSTQKYNLMSWADAKVFCQNLRLAGGGWRLPTKAELESLHDEDLPESSLDPIAFPNAESGGYWSSSPSAEGNGAAWVLSSGSARLFQDSQLMNVRCVR